MSQSLLPDEKTLNQEAEQGTANHLQDIQLLKKLWPFLKPDSKDLFLSLALLVPATLSQVSMPFIVKQALDGPIRLGDINGLWQYCGLFLLAFAVHYSARFQVMSRSQQVGQRIVFRLRNTLYQELTHRSAFFFQSIPLGKLVARTTSDVENVSEMFASGGISILMDIIVIVGVMIALWIMSPGLAVLVYGCFILLLGSLELLRQGSRNAYNQIRVRVGQMSGFLQENFAGIDVVKIYQREAFHAEDFARLNRKNLTANQASVFFDSTITATVELLMYLAIIAVLWFGAEALHQGTLTLGLLVGFFQLVQMAFEPMDDLSQKYTVIQSGLASIEKIWALLDSEPSHGQTPVGSSDVLSNPTESASDTKHSPLIRFAHVSFHYPVRANASNISPKTQSKSPLILNNIQLEIPAKQTVALIGPTGAGKSTLFKLLMGFYQPQEGAIFLKGTPITQLPLNTLRQHMAMIQQDDFLFSRSILDNITLSPVMPNMVIHEKLHEKFLHEAFDPERLEKALAYSMTADLLKRRDLTPDFVLAERGKNLSSGERQLLLFARALYHNPEILLLDEATSAVDPETERLIQQALLKVMQDRTTLIIAHRLSTLTHVDRILVLHQGSIVQDGSHAELIQDKAGLYHQFVHYYESL